MTWHKSNGASVKTPHVPAPKPSMPKAAKAKTTNQKTAAYTAKPVQKSSSHSVKKVK